MAKEIKKRKIKHKTHKFFGYKDDKGARGCGPRGYKYSYGHFGGHDFRSKAERKNADDLKDKGE